jgi:hypothetical protein
VDRPAAAAPGDGPGRLTVPAAVKGTRVDALKPVPVQRFLMKSFALVPAGQEHGYPPFAGRAIAAMLEAS